MSNTPWLWLCEVLTDEGLESRGVEVDEFPVLHPLIEELRNTWFKINSTFSLIAPYLRQPRASCWAVLDLALVAVGRGVGRKSWVGTSSSWRSGRQSNKPKKDYWDPRQQLQHPQFNMNNSVKLQHLLLPQLLPGWQEERWVPSSGWSRDVRLARRASQSRTAELYKSSI